MQKRSSKPKRPADPNLLARQVVEEVIGEPIITITPNSLIHFPVKPKIKNPAAIALGKLGGKKGGKARAEKLSPERKKEIAQKAAQTRWARKTGV